MHAADGQYHLDCYKLFMNHKNVQAATNAKTNVSQKECSTRSADRDRYRTRLSPDDAYEACSDLLLKLLAELSPKLDHTNTALLIGNIITSVLTNRPTTLQITLGTILREKSLTEQCADFVDSSSMILLRNMWSAI